MGTKRGFFSLKFPPIVSVHLFPGFWYSPSSFWESDTRGRLMEMPGQMDRCATCALGTKALLQRVAGDYLCTEKQITHIPSSVIKSHSWLGEIPATTFLPPLERRKPMIILLPFIIIQCGINCPGLELSSAQEGQYMNIPCVSRGHFK